MKNLKTKLWYKR